MPWDDPELLNEMLTPIWCNRGVVYSVVEWFRSLRRDGARDSAQSYQRRELRRPTRADSLPLVNSAKSDGSI